MALTFNMKAEVEAVAFTGFDQTEPIRKTRNWKNEIVAFDSAKEQRLQIDDEPKRHWFINWPMLDLAARNKLKEIHDAARGTFDTFLWLDDDEYLADGETISTDGVETDFQLQVTYHPGETYEWTETKKDIVPSGIYPPVIVHDIDGTQVEGVDFTLDDSTGILVFGSAPSAGTLTCTFEYYWRVRFMSDVYEDIQIAASPLYRAGDLVIVEVKA